jgi:hypothetical protein
MWTDGWSNFNTWVPENITTVDELVATELSQNITAVDECVQQNFCRTLQLWMSLCDRTLAKYHSCEWSCAIELLQNIATVNELVQQSFHRTLQLWMSLCNAAFTEHHSCGWICVTEHRSCGWACYNRTFAEYCSCERALPCPTCFFICPHLFFKHLNCHPHNGGSKFLWINSKYLPVLQILVLIFLQCIGLHL